MGCLKWAWTELNEIWRGHSLVISSTPTNFKNISDILLCFETRAAQNKESSKVEVKNRTFDPLYKLWEGWGTCLREKFKYSL